MFSAGSPRTTREDTAVLAGVHKAISAGFLHGHSVLLSVSLWRKPRPSHSFPEPQMVQITLQSIRTDTPLSVGMDPRKRSQVAVIPLNKPLITQPHGSLRPRRSASHLKARSRSEHRESHACSGDRSAEILTGAPGARTPVSGPSCCEDPCRGAVLRG